MSQTNQLKVDHLIGGVFVLDVEMESKFFSIMAVLHQMPYFI